MSTPPPRFDALDAAPAFLREGYAFVGARCARFGSDIFATRLLGTETICMRGPEAAQRFYDPELFVREGATPAPVRLTLFGLGAVQGLDGEAHRHRKALHLEILAPERVERLVAAMEAAWRERFAAWAERSRDVVLLLAMRELLCEVAFAWAGVPVRTHEVPHYAARMAALVEGAGAADGRHLRAHWARRRATQWAAAQVERVRSGALNAPPESALARIAAWQEEDGSRLPPRVAAAELLNVLRPTVALDRFVTYAALALHHHPEARERLGAGDAAYRSAFVHEVRRYYPFFPMVAARVRRDFAWRDVHFPPGRRVVLDLYGTNHHPEAWDEPQAFRPERFLDAVPDVFHLVPQGGGDRATGHRCAGEPFTVTLMERAVDFLAHEAAYEVPPQDLSIDLARIPARPKSGFRLRARPLA